MSQMGGGLRWHGVSKTGSTATSRIMNAAKAEREKANRSAPKVGSASVTDGDDWLAVAAAERAARERTGATGNAFADGASLVREVAYGLRIIRDEFRPLRRLVTESALWGAPAGPTQGSRCRKMLILAVHLLAGNVLAVEIYF